MSDNHDNNNDVPPWLQPVPEAENEAGFFSGKRGTIFAAGAAVGLVIVFVVAIVLLYDDAPRQAPRVVTADTSPIKQKPTDPGGMEVEHRDKRVFDVANGNAASSRVELGEQPEQPVDEIPNLPEEPVNTIVAQTADRIGDLAEAATNQTTEVVADVPNDATVNAPTEPKPEPAEEQPTPEVLQPTAIAADKYRVQLGAYGSEQSAATAWRTVRGKFLNQLRDLQPQYEAVQTGDRTLYRLRVGPLETRTDADQVCIALRAQQQACIVVNP
ncbi:SPOR domain-containing protein [Kordiimonas aquimaris]|uniref:SPOR domain-containing protein n=1 Tax=Kordiimonas aquimaris TaxID=707591 RepID=UPI0021CF9FB8|nr:SPOR domain-containing protein [Kordiimonas aquimaris]